MDKEMKRRDVSALLMEREREREGGRRERRRERVILKRERERERERAESQFCGRCVFLQVRSIIEMDFLIFPLGQASLSLSLSPSLSLSLSLSPLSLSFPPLTTHSGHSVFCSYSEREREQEREGR